MLVAQWYLTRRSLFCHPKVPYAANISLPKVQVQLAIGGPLSLFLFILRAKGLAALFDEWEKQGRIKGVKVCKNAPSVNHLLFADDSFIFARSTQQECMQMKRVLEIYEMAFGQAINSLKELCCVQWQYK